MDTARMRTDKVSDINVSCCDPGKSQVEWKHLNYSARFVNSGVETGCDSGYETVQVRRQEA